MKTFSSLLALILLISLLQSEAALQNNAELNINEIENRIEKRQAKTRSLEAHFTQSVLPPHHTQPILSEGIIQYHRPQTLRIDYSNPEGEGMILTKTETTVWKKGLLPKSDPHDPQKPSFRRIILDILERKPSDWNHQFHKSARQMADSIMVTLTPLTPSERTPDQVLVTMRSHDLQITAIAVTIKELQWEVKFDSIQVNPSLKIKLTK